MKNRMILCAKSHLQNLPLWPVSSKGDLHATNCCVFLIVPVIKSTIGQHTTRIVYYSETVDPSIPTESTGVPNTESGKEFYCWYNILTCTAIDQTDDAVYDKKKYIPLTVAMTKDSA